MHRVAVYEKDLCLLRTRANIQFAGHFCQIDRLQKVGHLQVLQVAFRGRFRTRAWRLEGNGRMPPPIVGLVTVAVTVAVPTSDALPSKALEGTKSSTELEPVAVRRLQIKVMSRVA